jgi:hypothetical protein
MRIFPQFASGAQGNLEGRAHALGDRIDMKSFAPNWTAFNHGADIDWQICWSGM